MHARERDKERSIVRKRVFGPFFALLMNIQWNAAIWIKVKPYEMILHSLTNEIAARKTVGWHKRTSTHVNIYFDLIIYVFDLQLWLYVWRMTVFADLCMARAKIY